MERRADAGQLISARGRGVRVVAVAGGAPRAYPASMSRYLGLLLLVACGPGGNSKPAGTTNDPVEVCERVADVCRIDKAKLGVCTQRRSGSGFVCASQH